MHVKPPSGMYVGITLALLVPEVRSEAGIDTGLRFLFSF